MADREQELEYALAYTMDAVRRLCWELRNSDSGYVEEALEKLRVADKYLLPDQANA